MLGDPFYERQQNYLFEPTSIYFAMTLQNITYKYF